MSALLHAATPWPVVVLWVVAVLIAQVLKAKQRPKGQPAAAGQPPESPARAEMGGALQRAMEKLKQAEREAKAARSGGPAVGRSASMPPARPPMRPSAAVRAPARVSLSNRPSARPPLRLAPLEDHSALSQESEPEVVDYDDEALASAARSALVARVAPSIRVTPPSEATGEIGAARPEERRASPLARFGDGSLRGAVVLSEILGRPLADR